MRGFVAHDVPQALPPLSTLLPHTLFVNFAEGIVLLATPRQQTLALGCVWQVIPRNMEVCDESVCTETARMHESLLRSQPLGAALQVIMHVHPATSAPRWEALRGAHPDDPLLASQVAALRRGLPHRLPTSQGQLRTVETFVTLRLPLADLRWGIAPLLQTLLAWPGTGGSDLAVLLQQHLRTTLDQLQGLRQLIDDTLLTAGHQAWRLDGVGVGMAVARGLDPFHPPSPVIVPHQPLATQVLQVPAELFAGGYAVGTPDALMTAHVLSLQRAPEQTYPGMLSAPRAPAQTQEPIALWQAYEGAFSVIANVAIVDATAEKARAERKRFVAKAHAHYSQRNKLLVRELNKLLDALFLRGGQLLWGRIHIVLWGDVATLPRAADRIVVAARKLGLEFFPEPDVGNTLFLQTLPLGFDPRYPKEDHVARARRISLDNLVNLLPLYGAFQGTSTPTILFVNQRGEAIGIDFFDSRTNRHATIVGTSGAGKSFTVTHIVNQMLGLGASGVIMDRLESYREVCGHWEGTYIELDFNDPPCFNPFYGPMDRAHQAFITASVAEMIGGGVEQVDREHKNVLADAVAYFAQTYDRTRGEPHLSPFVQDVLGDGCFSPEDRDARTIGRTLARKLTLYMQGRGPNAGFVDGPNTLVLHPCLTVLEFSKLRNARDLIGIIFFNLMHLLRQFYAAPERRFQRKFAIFEEAWAPLRYAETAEELDEAIRTYRRLYTSIIFVSNVLKDFDSPTGQVIKALSAHKLFLQQEPEELAQLQEIFALTGAETRVVAQAKKHADFSSLYCKLAGQSGGLLYLVPDGYARWLATQQDQEKALREATVAAMGGDLRRAVADLATRYPHGLPEGSHA